MLTLKDYSEKSVAVQGDTRPHSETLKQMGGKFNRYLSGGPGWIFGIKKKPELLDLVQKINASEPATGGNDGGMSDYIDAQLNAGYCR
jgi:hypothetical protein